MTFLRLLLSPLLKVVVVGESGLRRRCLEDNPSIFSLSSLSTAVCHTDDSPRERFLGPSDLTIPLLQGELIHQNDARASASNGLHLLYGLTTGSSLRKIDTIAIQARLQRLMTCPGVCWGRADPACCQVSSTRRPSTLLRFLYWQWRDPSPPSSSPSPLLLLLLLLLFSALLALPATLLLSALLLHAQRLSCLLSLEPCSESTCRYHDIVCIRC